MFLSPLAVAEGGRRMLMAMATGKTKLAIAMLYRLLASKRFRRICFVVDYASAGRRPSWRRTADW